MTKAAIGKNSRRPAALVAHVSGIAVLGGRLFATINKAVYVSDSNGEFWDKVESGINGCVPMNLAAAAVVCGNRLIVGGARGSIYQ